MAKAQNRPGFGNMVGAINSKSTASYNAPQEPKTNDIWINQYDNTISKWSGTAWVLISPIVISDVAPANLGAVWVKPGTP